MRSLRNLVLVHAFKSKTRDELRDLDELLELIESHLDRRSKTLAQEIESKSATLSDREQEELIGWHSDDFDQLENVFPTIIRNALFAALMTIAESNVANLCLVTKRVFKLQNGFKKPQGSVIKAALLYLEKEASIDLSNVQVYSQQLDIYRRIRNCIVHSEGKNTDREPAELKALCKKIRTIKFWRDGRITLKKGAVDIASHEISHFFEEIYKSWTQKAQHSLADD